MENKFCKDCFLLELRTYYLKTEKVSGYCARLQQRKNGNDVCEGGNEKLHPKGKKGTNNKCEKYTL